jgi:hypothetical protein
MSSDERSREERAPRASRSEACVAGAESTLGVGEAIAVAHMGDVRSREERGA